MRNSHRYFLAEYPKEILLQFSVVSLIFAILPSCGRNENNFVSRSEMSIDTTMAPGKIFSNLEQTLLNTGKLAVDCKIQSEGVVTCSLQGKLVITADNHVDIHFSGNFADKTDDIHFTSDRLRMKGGSGPTIFDESSPQAIKEAVLIGFTRMGILHNLARLSSGSPPDGADGTVEIWITVAYISLGKADALSQTICTPLNFFMYIEDQPVGETILWLDRKTGLPLLRKQTVHFPEGEMVVEEHYKGFTIE